MYFCFVVVLIFVRISALPGRRSGVQTSLPEDQTGAQ